MRFPSVTDVTQILDHALYLRHPDTYPKPPAVVIPTLMSVTVGGIPNIHRAPVKHMGGSRESVNDTNGKAGQSNRLDKPRGSIPSVSFSSKFKSLSNLTLKKPNGKGEKESPDVPVRENGFPRTEYDQVTLWDEVRQMQSIMLTSYKRLTTSIKELEDALSSSAAVNSPEVDTALQNIKDVALLLEAGIKTSPKGEVKERRITADSTAMTLFKVTPNPTLVNLPQERIDGSVHDNCQISPTLPVSLS